MYSAPANNLVRQQYCTYMYICVY